MLILNENKELDILVISPHPDDAELMCGGMLLKCKQQGYRAGILHLTAGEMGSFGDKQTRIQEMQACGKELHLDYIGLSDFKDCQIIDDFESRLKIATYLRRLKPKIVFSPCWEGIPGRWVGHTDHLTAGGLVSHAVNFARLQKLPIDQPVHTVKKIIYYYYPLKVCPSFFVDISSVALQWIKALRCYRSQLTGKSTRHFIQGILSQAKANGLSIGTRYAQGFVLAEPFQLDNILTLVE